MDNFDFYPEKPILEEVESKGNLPLTIVSMLLFILSFLMMFSEELQFIIHLVIVLVIHELGHFLMMKWFGYKDVRMMFIPLMGAFVQGRKDHYSQKQGFFVIGAGPFPGIIIGSILIILALSTKSVWMVNLGLLFLFLNVLNLVPLDPLDGGQLFKLLIRKKQDLFLLVFSLISSLILIAVGWIIQNWLLIAFGFFMGIRVRSFQRQYELRKLFREENIAYQSTYAALSNRDFAKIKAILLVQVPSLRQYIDMLDADKADQYLASQVNGVLLPPLNQDASRWLKVFFICCWLFVLISPILIFMFFGKSLQLNYDWYLEAISTQ